VLNTDAADYGGSNAGNRGVLVSAADRGTHTLRLVVPPLATIFLVRES
jgi:1,4-alpha-glucan branching enzyme